MCSRVSVAAPAQSRHTISHDPSPPAGREAVTECSNDLWSSQGWQWCAGRPKEAYAMALKVTDRFKGRRTKYYVLKGFLSVAEVVLSLLEWSGLDRRLGLDLQLE